MIGRPLLLDPRRWTSAFPLARRVLGDRRGVSAVEFAIILPFVLLVSLGGFQVSQALSVYRKMTITARAVADLASQYSTMSSADIATVFNASAQIMAPYPTSGLSIVLTEYSTTVLGVSTVTWSKAFNNATPAVPGTIVILPPGIAIAGGSIIMSQVAYAYAPTVGYQLTGTHIMSDHLYMAPRQVQSIALTGS